MVLNGLTLTVESVVFGAGESALAAGETSLEWGSDGLGTGLGGEALSGRSGCSLREHVLTLVVTVEFGL